MKIITHYNDIKKYTTKDKSTIRELMHPSHNDNSNQSIAEAVVTINNKTLLHKHLQTEEIYHITQGKGLMTLDTKIFEVAQGDTICILPDTAHCIKNIGDSALHFLCLCAPAYDHDDTIILENANLIV
ncbi:MAG: cupin domain-containing protein [Gammaproteobacteria bacterium]